MSMCGVQNTNFTLLKRSQVVEQPHDPVNFVQQHLCMVLSLTRQHGFEYVLTRNPCKAAFSM